MSEQTFDDALSSLCCRELAAARRGGDSERIAGMVQALTLILGKTIAMATAGNSEACDMLLIGVENLMREEAAGFAPLADLAARRGQP